jgi:error-prone DNA polymerase
LPLDVNESLGCYAAEDGAIRIGFCQLKGMTSESIRSILNERCQGKFTSVRDLMLRTNVSRPILENLVKVGACDQFGGRASLLLELSDLLQLSCKLSRGKKSLFEYEQPRPCIRDDIQCDNPKYKMLVERELLYLDLSAHPLDFCNLNDGFTRIKDLPTIAAGKIVKIAGSVIRYQTPPTRNGKRVVYVIMEDGTGIADVTVFSDVQERCGHVLFQEEWLVVKGKIQRRGPKALSVIAYDLSPLTTD